jgi:hypothetical protein
MSGRGVKPFPGAVFWPACAPLVEQFGGTVLWCGDEDSLLAAMYGAFDDV